MRRKTDKNDALASVNADLPFVLLVMVLLMLAAAIFWMNPEATVDTPQENALRVEATWDEALPGKGPANNAAQQSRGDPRQSRVRPQVRQNLLEREGVALRPGHSAADVDLWMCKVGSARQCIGYNTPGRQTPLFKLDSDDLGWNRRDVKDDLNVEIMTARRSQLPAGTYVINIHLFSLKGEALPIVAKVRVLINEGQPNQVMLERTVTLTDNGQEKNAFVFDVNEEGDVMPDSVTEDMDSMCIATC